MYSHILVPTDGSPLSTVAMEKSIEFARDAGAKVTILAVTRPLHIGSASSSQNASGRSEQARHDREHAAEYVTVGQQKAKQLGVPCEAALTEDDQPYRAIIRTADKNGCDLIAMASHGRRGVRAIVLGSETLKVLTHSKTPVLVYR